MRKSRLAGFLMIFLLTMVASPSINGLATPNDIRDTYIVLFKDDVDPKVHIPESIHVEQIYSVISAATVKATEEEVKILEQLPDVQALQKDFTYEVGAEQVPWGFNPSKLTEEVRSNYTGKGVKVGILDTGADATHPELQIAGGVCLLERCVNGFKDDNGHGTHVAGIIGAKGNKSNVTGVAPEVELYAIKVIGQYGDGSTTSILSGVEWALQKKLDIINLSITSDVNDLALRKMLNQAYEAGMLIVAAAGNEGDLDKEDSVLYPAKYDSVIAVGAVDRSLKRLPSSARGAQLEFVAPGYNILSTVPKAYDYDGRVDGYTRMSGTSMASPYVAGMLALYKEARPFASNKEIRQWMARYTKDLGPKGRDPLYGYGFPTFTAYDETEMMPNEQTVTSQVLRGKVTFTMNVEGQTYSVYRNGRLLQKNSTDAVLTDYVKEGMYHYLFTFQDTDGQLKKLLKRVHVDRPVMADVDMTNWYAPPMIYLYGKDIIRGQSNNQFLPGTQITRGEAVAMLGRALSLNEQTVHKQFKDVSSSSFAAGYIQAAYDRGILTGFSDGTFRPNQPVTRAEMAILLSNGLKLQAYSGKFTFKDVNQNVTGRDAIYRIYGAGITKGYAGGTFQPYTYISRAEYSMFIARALDDQFKEY